MKKPIIFIVIIVVVLIIAGGAYWLGTRPETNTTAADQIATNTAPPVNTATENTNTAVITSDSTYIGDDFTITQPVGWVQTTIPGTLAALTNSTEQHPEGSAAAKIHFQSYIAISFDNTEGKTLDEVNQAAIDGITSAITSANAFDASDETVNGLPAKFSAMTLTQQDVDYTVLIAVYYAGDRYYTASFNTTDEKWTEYKDSFYEIARSFALKG